MSRMLASLVFLIACGDPVAEMPDAAPSSDAALDAPAQSSDCTSGESFAISGPLVLSTPSAAVSTLSGKVIGVAGASGGGRLYGLSVRRPLMHDFDAVGSYDVATVQMKYLEGTGCDTPGACQGFFALAGTFVVHERQPRYRATFTLTDLRRHDDTSDTLGEPIAGTITGCVNANVP